MPHPGEKVVGDRQTLEGGIYKPRNDKPPKAGRGQEGFNPESPREAPCQPWV